jgi:carbon monoxide dehydrogenase subunit G
MTRFETTVAIARARNAVFAYVADPRHVPAWNSAVESVVPLNDATPAAGSGYVMQRQLPTGTATNKLEIVTLQPPEELAIRTTSGPTPFLYRYEFATTGAGTLVRLHADVRVGGAASLLGPLAAQAIKRGVDANLATLRDILERADS